jgi:hypothetical protein
MKKYLLAATALLASTAAFAAQTPAGAKALADCCMELAVCCGVSLP